jgi:hypothetical protein
MQSLSLSILGAASNGRKYHAKAMTSKKATTPKAASAKTAPAPPPQASSVPALQSGGFSDCGQPDGLPPIKEKLPADPAKVYKATELTKSGLEPSVAPVIQKAYDDFNKKHSTKFKPSLGRAN